jgi:hypothetical protein
MALKRLGAPDLAIKNQLGMVKVSKEGPATIKPLSPNTAATVYTPLIYWDAEAGVYHATSEYKWNDQQTKGDSAGGYDAFAIRFSADIVNHNAASIFWPGEWGGAQPYPERYPDSIAPQPEDNSEAGASFKFQDKLFKNYCSGTDYPSCWNYLGAWGLIGVSFTRIPGTKGLHSSIL